MRRLSTALLVAVLLLPSIAMMSSSARAACCCKTSGACPLRGHTGCEKNCSINRSDAAPASSFRAPELPRDPAVLMTMVHGPAPSLIDFVAVFSAQPLSRATPPALPPPRA